MRFQIRTYSVIDESTGPLEEISVFDTLTPEQAEKDAQTLLAWMNGNLPMQTWDAFWALVQVESDQEASIAKMAGSIWDKLWEEQNPVPDDTQNLAQGSQ